MQSVSIQCFVRRIGESPSICPFLKLNGDEALKGPNPIMFQEWTDTNIFSDLKYTSTKRQCIMIDIGRFLFAHGELNVLCLKQTALSYFEAFTFVGRSTFLSSPHLCFIIVFICDLFVSRDDPLMS